MMIMWIVMSGMSGSVSGGARLLRLRVRKGVVLRMVLLLLLLLRKKGGKLSIRSKCELSTAGESRC